MYKPALFTCCIAMLWLVSVSAAQKVYTVAGGYLGDGGPATAASLASPEYAAFDAHGNLYISDTGNNRIRRVDTAGNISTIAGNGFCGFTGDGGPAAKAEICEPMGLVFDAAGDLLFSDSANLRIRMINPSGKIATIAGSGTSGYCGDGGPAIKACLNYPQEVAVASTASDEMLYIADTQNCRIRQVSKKTGIISTAAGNGTCAYSGDGGPATNASLNSPSGVAVFPGTNTLWISDTANDAIRQVDTETGIITTFFGGGGNSCQPQLQDLCEPEGIAVDTVGNLYIADTGLSRVLQIAAGNGGAVTQLVGVDTQGFNGDGIPAVNAVLNIPSSITLDSKGNLFTVDNGNDRVREGSGSANISTVAGGYIGDGGPSIGASINANVFENNAFDAHGNLYITDAQNHRIRKVSPAGVISTFAGTGFSGYTGDGGPATQAELNFPQGVAIDRGGNVFIADSYNLAIRKVNQAGTISTFATGLFFPAGLAMDPMGNLYAADYAFCTVWMFSPTGIGTIVAGVQFDCGFNGDGILANQA